MGQLGYAVLYAISNERMQKIIRYLERNPLLEKEFDSESEIFYRVKDGFEGRVMAVKSLRHVVTQTLINKKVQRGIDKLARK